MDPVLGKCTLADLRRRRSVKWTTYPVDVLPAWVAEMDFDLAAPITAALSEALEWGDCGYANPHDFGEPFAEFSRSRWHWAPDPSRVFAVPDVMTGIAEVVKAVTEPGAGIVINPPVYPPFFSRTAFSGRHCVEAPLARYEAGRYELDLDAIDGALGRDGVGAYLLCNPHNPVGRAWSAADLLSVAELCQRHGVWLLVDEIHSPLVLGGTEHTPVLSLDHDMVEKAFAFVSASKGWNVAGLACASVVAGSQASLGLLTERWEVLLPSHLGVIATEAAFGRSVSWLDAARDQLGENRRLLADLLEAHLPSVNYVPPEASFLAWLDCRELGLGEDPAAGFLEQGRVALTPGENFGAEGRGFARLNIGTSAPLVEEAVRRMAAAVNRDAT